MVTQTAPPEADTETLPQYSRSQILVIWVVVTAPMSIGAWILAPWGAHHLHTRDPFIDALVLAFNLALLWQVGVALALVRRERGTLAWPAVRDALALNRPRDHRNPRNPLSGHAFWWWALAFTAASVVVNFLPVDPVGPFPRDFPKAILSQRVQDYFAGNWYAYAMMTVNALLAPVAEELLFRGVLLRRTRAVFGRANVLANGALFTLYHLHQPWSMPATFIDGTLNQAYASDRFRSTWMGLITHTALSAPALVTVLLLVLR